MFDWIYRIASRDLAIDLGTANTLIYMRAVECIIAVVR